jgi:hypothetical protein
MRIRIQIQPTKINADLHWLYIQLSRHATIISTKYPQLNPFVLPHTGYHTVPKKLV